MRNQEDLVELYWKALKNYLADVLSADGIKRSVKSFLELPQSQRPNIGSSLVDMNRLRNNREFRAQIAHDSKQYLDLDVQTTNFRITPLLTKSAYLTGISEILDSTNKFFPV